MPAEDNQELMISAWRVRSEAAKSLQVGSRPASVPATSRSRVRNRVVVAFAVLLPRASPAPASPRKIYQLRIVPAPERRRTVVVMLGAHVSF
jgi:hypothetical protein